MYLCTCCLQGGSCKWWHFYPDEGVQELEAKFKEIISGAANNQIIDKLIKGAKSIARSDFLKSILTYEKPAPREDPEGELEIWNDHML